MTTEKPIRIYYWKDNALATSDALTAEAKGYLCLDTKYAQDRLRFGIYDTNTWKAVPLEEFPPEFRMHLLLLGVSW